MNKAETKLLKMLLQSSETTLLNACRSYLENNYGKHNVFLNNNFIYAIGDIPVMLVAHLDTVWHLPPQIKITSDGNEWTSNTGLGADDRAGVFAILQIIKKGLRPSILFTSGEERGGVGASEFVNFFPEPPVPTKYIIEIDRRGKGQAVYYDCGNPSFENYVSSFGFTTHQGIFSDISFICPFWKVAGVNLSAGYYNEHTSNELLSIKDLKYTMTRVKRMLKDASNAKYYEYITTIPNGNNDLFLTCNICKNKVPYFNAFFVGGTQICANCLSTQVNWCEKCNKPFLNNGNIDALYCDMCEETI